MEGLKKYLVPALLCAIILLGFFLRSYHFSDWLHFELDQARDARVIDAALSDGPDELPLLGPKAGGTFLRLAPGFYYLEYISALLFGETPSGMAVFVLVFSVFSLPLFYLLVRRFFSLEMSLGLTLLFSVSHFFVMYGRFAWNPNLLPFFILLGLYALLRAVDNADSKRGRFFVISVVSFALATHFHFLALLTAPVIMLLFLLWKRPRFSWKTWMLALGLALFTYLPMLLNEIEAGYTNTEEFLGAITEKSNKDEHPLIEKAVRNISEHALHALVITTGFEGGMFPAIVISGEVFGWACDSKCDAGKWYGVAAVVVLGISVLALGWLLWQKRKENNSPPMDFLVLMTIWLGVTFLVFLPLSYSIAPRFFLLSGPLFLILIGFILVVFQKLIGNRVFGGIMAGGVLLVLVLLNLFFLQHRFDEMARAGTEPIESVPDRILKERIRVTLEQQESIVDFLEARSKEQGYVVYMFSEPQHRRALKYLLEKRGIENAVLGFDGIYRQGVYYLILRAKSDQEDALRKYGAHYTIGETIPFGTLVAIKLTPKPETIIGERQDFSMVKPSDNNAPPRYTWRELIDRNSDSSSPPSEDDRLEEIEDKAKDQ